MERKKEQTLEMGKYIQEKRKSPERILFYFLAVLLLIAFHCTYDLSFGDVEIMFGKALIPGNELGNYEPGQNILQAIWNYSVWRYQGWTSRNIIELVLIIIAGCPRWVWHVTDILSVLLIIYCIDEMAEFEYTKPGMKYLLLSLLLLCYPLVVMRSAGWVATTLNYTWVLAAGLYLTLVVLRIDKGEKKVSKRTYFLAIISSLFALNQEQFCALFLGILLAAFIREYYNGQKLSKELFPFLFIDLTELAYIFTCPGNHVRNSVGTGADAGLSMWTRLYEGICGLLKGMFGAGGFLLLFFLLAFICYAAVIGKRSRFLQVGAFLSLGYLVLRVVSRAPVLKGMVQKLPLGFLLQADFRENYLTAIFGGAILTIILWMCLSLSYGQERFFLLWAAWAGAIATKVVLGFTTSIFESGERTSVFVWFTCLITLLFLVKKEEKNCSFFAKKWFQICLGISVMMLVGYQFLTLCKEGYSF